MGSVFATHGPSCPTAHGILAPQPGIEPVFPTLKGSFLTTGLLDSIIVSRVLLPHTPKWCYFPILWRQPWWCKICRCYVPHQSRTIKSCGFIISVFPPWSHECTYVCVHAQSCLTLATPWSIAHQAPLSMEISSQECWSGLPFTSLGDLSNPGIKPASPALAGRFFTAATWEAQSHEWHVLTKPAPSDSFLE